MRQRLSQRRAVLARAQRRRDNMTPEEGPPCQACGCDDTSNGLCEDCAKALREGVCRCSAYPFPHRPGGGRCPCDPDGVE